MSFGFSARDLFQLSFVLKLVQSLSESRRCVRDEERESREYDHADHVSDVNVLTWRTQEHICVKADANHRREQRRQPPAIPGHGKDGG